MRFYLGIHHPDRARDLWIGEVPACISANALARRRSGFLAPDWILDSGAFSQIAQHGRFTTSIETYARLILRFSLCGDLNAAVSQDYMCEPLALARTGLSIADHQRLTIERYEALRAALRRLEGAVYGADGDIGKAPYLMPVLQGISPDDYAACLKGYRHLIKPGAWVGVGSLCKRQGHPREIEAVLRKIKQCRPDLRLHGFGVKLTALGSPRVRDMLYSADSMAWSYAARRQGGDSNDLTTALRFALKVCRLDPDAQLPSWAPRLAA